MGRENRVGIFELLQNPELADLFKVALRALSVDLRTHTLCTVTNYNAATQRVDVTVDMLQVVNDAAVVPSAADPNPTTTQTPIPLKDVPVAWPRTSTGYQTFPLKTGDRGELHVQDRSIDGYLIAGQVAEPARRWTHSLADAIFRPCLYHNAAPIVPATDLLATVLHDDVRIKLGRAAVAFVLKGTTVHTAFTAWMVAIAAAAVTRLIPPGPPVTDSAFITAFIAATATLQTTLGSWLSLKVQTE